MTEPKSKKSYQSYESRESHKSHFKSLLPNLLLIAVSLLFALPFIWMVGTSLKTDAQVFQVPPTWWPKPFQWENYANTLRTVPFLLYTWNTTKIATLTAIGTAASSALVAYSLAKVKWRGAKWIFITVIGSMLLPSQVTIIPTFALFKWLGWVGGIQPLVVPSFFGSAFSIFLLRQFFMTIPAELSDAARLDGCSDFEIFRRVVVPLSRPAIVTVALFAFMGAWNDFLGPLLYLTDDRTFTLALGIQRFVGQHGAEWSLLMAASTMMSLPMILIFFLSQKTFVQGVTLTGIKG